MGTPRQALGRARRRLRLPRGCCPVAAQDWLVLLGCLASVCTLEAVTTQIDNLFLPLFLATTLLLVIGHMDL